LQQQLDEPEIAPKAAELMEVHQYLVRLQLVEEKHH
jgi:hypothetical protein